MITVSNQQKRFPLSLDSVKKLVTCVLEEFDASEKQVTIYFVTKKKISELHAQFFDDPSPTDCISFPMQDMGKEGRNQKAKCKSEEKGKEKKRRIGHEILGEVFVCPEVAVEYAKRHQLEPYQELSLYVVHGLLHLLGYDDLEPKERREMRSQEKKCLKLLAQKRALLKNGA